MCVCVCVGGGVGGGAIWMRGLFRLEVLITHFFNFHFVFLKALIFKYI